MADDGNVVDFRPKVVEGGKKDGPPAIAVACHCSSTNFELMTNSVIKCARCGCAFEGSWKWSSAR